MSKFRVGIVGLRLEATLRSPIPTDRTTMRVYRGREICDPAPDVMDGICDRLAGEPDVELVPLLFIRTLPGGGMKREVYESIKAEMLELIARAAPLDGLMIANHGAMEVEGLPVHGDTDFVTAVRQLVGPNVVISIPFDLHGQVTPELVSALTVFSVMRTAPHRDVRETSRRAADQLLQVLRGKLKPVKAVAPVPIIVPGELAMTVYSPAQELYDLLPEFDRRPDVIEANIFVGMGWNDRAWIGMKAAVVCRESVELAERYAQELGEAIWARRRDFTLKMESASVAEGLLRSQSVAERPVYLSDSGDNTTAGAGGDLTFVLQEAMRLAQIEDLVIPGITAPDIVARCHAAGVGARVELRLGQEHRTAPVQELRVTGVVEALGDSIATRMAASPALWARVRFGNVIASFHGVRIAFATSEHFAAIGLDASSHKAYVVKLGYLSPNFADLAGRHIVLTSVGLSNLDLQQLDYTHIARPIYPLDPDMTWLSRNAVYSR